MIARVLALLLAVLVMVGAAAQAYAQPGPGDSTSVIDDAPDAVLPVAPAPVVVATPERPAAARAVPLPARVFGRIHAVVIFRPPR